MAGMPTDIQMAVAKAKLMGPTNAQRWALGSAYDAASVADNSIMQWDPIRGGVDSHLLDEKEDLDAKSGDIIRNDGYAQSALDIYKNSIVGPQYALQAQPNLTILNAGNRYKLSEAWADEFQEEVEAKFGAWANSPDNFVDTTRQNTFAELVRLALGCFFQVGETFAVLEFKPNTDSPYATSVQMVSNDRVSNPENTIHNWHKVRGGIEYNAQGAPVAYFIKKSSRGGLFDFREPNLHRRVTKYTTHRRLQVIHIMEQNTPGQTRGISRMVAGMKEMRMARKLRDITLQGIATRASFAAFIKSELHPDVLMEMLASNNSTAFANFSKNYLETVNAYTKDAPNFVIDGARIPVLQPGTTFEATPLGNATGLGDMLEQSLIQNFAATTGIDMPTLTHNFNDANYSSARAGMNQSGKNFMTTKKMVADRFATSVYRPWLQEAMHKGHIETLNNRFVPNYYEGLNKEAYSDCYWIGAGRGQIDELKETQAAALAIKSGFTTYEAVMSRMGLNGLKVHKKLAKEQKNIEALGLKLADDNSMNAVEGGAKPKTGRNPEDPEGKSK